MRVFCSPTTYIQGPDILENQIEVFKSLGERGIIVTDQFVWNLVGKNLSEKLQVQGQVISKFIFSGESSENEVRKLNQLIEEEVLDFVIGLGGGKAIDVAKSVGDHNQLIIAVVPTTASTDAPTSRVSVIYHEDNRFSHYQSLRQNPDLVFVDTSIIVQAPPRFLASGIADGLATLVEVNAIRQAHQKNLVGGQQTLAALAIAEKCEEILFSDGKKAMQANGMRVVTEAFENVVEANTLLSGIGFESGGLAAAHAMHNALSVLSNEVHQLTHGEKIAFTTLVQLMLENATEARLNQFIFFYRSLHLPTTLAEMKLASIDQAELLKIAEHAVNHNDTMSRMPFEVTPETLYSAIIALDRYASDLID